MGTYFEVDVASGSSTIKTSIVEGNPNAPLQNLTLQPYPGSGANLIIKDAAGMQLLEAGSTTLDLGAYSGGNPAFMTISGVHGTIDASAPSNFTINSDFIVDAFGEIQSPSINIGGLLITNTSPTPEVEIAGTLRLDATTAPTPQPNQGLIYFDSGSNTLQFSQNGGPFAPLTATPPGGTAGAVQFNDSGTFGGNTFQLYWDNVNYRLAIGVNTPYSSLDVFGSFGASVTTKLFADSPYTILNTDYTVFANAISGNIVATLPLASSAIRRMYVIKKLDSSVNTVTLGTSGSDMIDGASSQVLNTQYQSLTVQSDGTNWWVI